MKPNGPIRYGTPVRYSYFTSIMLFFFQDIRRRTKEWQEDLELEDLAFFCSVFVMYFLISCIRRSLY